MCSSDSYSDILPKINMGSILITDTISTIRHYVSPNVAFVGNIHLIENRHSLLGFVVVENTV